MKIEPVGFVKEENLIEIKEEFIDALNGIDREEYLWVLYVFHLAEERLKVHPLGCSEIEERGVFSTRSPLRPNRIGMTLVKLRKREKRLLYVSGLDAEKGSPVIDIKPFAPLYDMPSGAVLPRQEILRRILRDGLIRDYVDLDTQLQASGFDMTLKSVFRIKNEGLVDFDNSERKIADVEEVHFDSEILHLPQGFYRIVYNEVVKLPGDIMAIGRPRSSLVRNGASILTAVWDPGYEGRSESGLVVYNPYGIKLKRNARVMQLVFIRLTEETEKEYDGVFKKENI